MRGYEKKASPESRGEAILQVFEGASADTPDADSVDELLDVPYAVLPDDEPDESFDFELDDLYGDEPVDDVPDTPTNLVDELFGDGDGDCDQTPCWDIPRTALLGHAIYDYESLVFDNPPFGERRPLCTEDTISGRPVREMVPWLPDQHDLESILAAKPVVAPVVFPDERKVCFPGLIMLEQGFPDITRVRTTGVPVGGQYPECAPDEVWSIGRVVEELCHVPRDLVPFAVLLLHSVLTNLESRRVTLRGNPILWQSESWQQRPPCDSAAAPDADVYRTCGRGQPDEASAFRLLTALCDEVAEELVVGNLCLQANTGRVISEDSTKSLAYHIADAYYYARWPYPSVWSNFELINLSGRPILPYAVAANAVDRAGLRQKHAAHYISDYNAVQRPSRDKVYRLGRREESWLWHRASKEVEGRLLYF